MKNINRHCYILKLFCKKLFYFDKQIKGNNMKEIWIKLAMKGAIKKVGCRTRGSGTYFRKPDGLKNQREILNKLDLYYRTELLYNS